MPRQLILISRPDHVLDLECELFEVDAANRFPKRDEKTFSYGQCNFAVAIKVSAGWRCLLKAA
jgi:hypothetical protein